jgi:hypothetical protein
LNFGLGVVEEVGSLWKITSSRLYRETLLQKKFF